MSKFTRGVVIALAVMIFCNLFLIHLLMSSSSINESALGTSALTRSLTVKPQNKYTFIDPILANQIMSKLDTFDLEFSDLQKLKFKSYFENLEVNYTYCIKHREYFANNSEYVFNQANFMTGWHTNTQVRRLTLNKNYDDSMPHYPPVGLQRKLVPQNLNISLVVTNQAMFFDRPITKQFGCLGQMANHIPGHQDITRKDNTVGALNKYAENYKTRPQCFDFRKFFPKSYQLFEEVQCKEFFAIFNSDAYLQEKKEKGVVYITKVGAGVHVGEGVHPVDDKEEDVIRKMYNNGTNCGTFKDNYIMQRFIHNTMLIDGYKFDFRVFLLVASTNPVIAYYYDGFLRLSDLVYDTFTVKKTSLVTNISPASRWNFDRFQNYLIYSGRVTDTNWIDNYLRPAFKKAMIHVVRMSQPKYMKISSVFELYGTDFMIDEDLNLWYIEANPGPRIQFDTLEMVEYVTKMLKDEFDIIFGLLRSRMKRVIDYVNDLTVSGEAVRLENGQVEIDNLPERIKEFNEVIKNRMEPEFEVSSENGFHKIIDENLKGSAAYLGVISEECL